MIAGGLPPALFLFGGFSAGKNGVRSEQAESAEKRKKYSLAEGSGKMVFSSLLFLFLFFPVVLLLYYLLPARFRNLVLLVVSLLFYAWGEPAYVFLMAATILLDFGLGLLVEYFQKKGNNRGAKGTVVAAVIINLGTLAFFKYTDFFIGNLNGVFGTALPLLQIALPIGISFYTFQILSYVIDVYRGDTQAQHSLVAFGAYVVLFPQLIAGPIVRYRTVADELSKRQESVAEFSEGIRRFLIGLGKKVLLANNIGIVWNEISSMDAGTLPVLTAWIGILAFTFQIYFDFSGYSDMAIGIGRMFGFHFLENFNYPYMARSITDFWRRWHISLSTWFKEYVYIPLGGNRRGMARQIRNILVVWLLTGFWHGAAWNFMLWGIYFGILLILEKLFLLRWLEKAPRWVGHLYAMFLVVLSWEIFAFDNLGAGVQYLGAMFGLNGAGLWNGQSIYLLYTNLLLFAILIFASMDWGKRLWKRLQTRLHTRPISAQLIQNAAYVGVFLLSVAYLVNASYNPFLYFRF